MAQLAKKLVSPNKVASALNWSRSRGAVLSLDIHKDRIGMAVASHPSRQEQSTPLGPIRYNFEGGRLPNEAKRILEDVVSENDVCCFVVSWPLQRDTGRMGAACGRTLHVIEELLQDSKVFDANRKLCLWDSEHTHIPQEDEWGRSADYVRTSSETLHKASEEQYHHDEGINAAQVWADFARAHWPDMDWEDEVMAA
eukprot:Nitzschia sp. Nitz4//scaffold37_size175936//69351//69941//NITZ4_002043-RA/size175936-processed-gene-0.186-mRNA-1//1//CDS//3329549779//3813//frame0